tara:strand:+ start:1433 stop:1855 length:423 start_codon:yes stop_codon:yes gene_type:complete
MNINKRFGAASGYPGEQTGMSLDQTRSAYILNKKIYGQAENLATGSNTAIDINLPKDGRLLIGISIYTDYDNAIENPTIDLYVNNTRFITATGARQVDITYLREQMFYPLNLPLSGQDTITMDINAVGNAKAISLQFHYV